MKAKRAERTERAAFGLLILLLFTAADARCILGFDIVPDLSVWKLGGSARVSGQSTYQLNQTTPQSGMSPFCDILIICSSLING